MRFFKRLFPILFLLIIMCMPVSADTVVQPAQAVTVMRNALKNRESNVKIIVHIDGVGLRNFDENVLKRTCDNILTQAYAHTGVQNEGDAINRAVKNVKKVFALYDVDNTWSEVECSYTFGYYDTAQQEKTCSANIPNIVSSLKISGKSDYVKLSKIYKYITKNIKYAKKNVPVKYSAYGALIDKDAYCQGYATLLYRMCCEAGIDCRTIEGRADGTAYEHLWNAVKINGSWYYCDPTWDATYVQAKLAYHYFLRGKNDFSDHHPETSTNINNSFISGISSKSYNKPSSVKKYKLTVTDGSGNGSYKRGKTVSITANAAPAGKKFSKWVFSGKVKIKSGSATSSSIKVKVTGTGTVAAKYVYAPVTSIKGIHKLLVNGSYMDIKSGKVRTVAKKASASSFKFTKTGDKYYIQDSASGKYLLRGKTVALTSKDKATKWTIVKSGSKYRFIADGALTVSGNTFTVVTDKNLKTQQFSF